VALWFLKIFPIDKQVYDNLLGQVWWAFSWIVQLLKTISYRLGCGFRFEHQMTLCCMDIHILCGIDSKNQVAVPLPAYGTIKNNSILYFYLLYSHD
jgi:hypothetical protein